MPNGKKDGGDDPKNGAGDKTPNNEPKPSDGGKAGDDSTLDAKALQAQKEHFRDKADKAEKELAKLQKEREASETARLEAEKKFEELYQKEKTRADQLEAKSVEDAKKFAFLKVASRHKVLSPDDAFKLIDQSKITVKDGVVDESSIEGVVKEFVEARPHFVESDPKTTPKGNGSTPPAGGGGDNHGDAPTFKRSQLRNAQFYQENKEAIAKAEIAGTIEND